MAQPSPYQPSTIFTDEAANYPDQHISGALLDVEFDNLATTLEVVLANLRLIQRDDGALRNQSVGLDTLSADALLSLGAGSAWVPRGTWAVGMQLAQLDVVAFGTRTYVTAIAHEATSPIDDWLASGHLLLLFDSEGTIPADGSVSTIKIADAAVTAAKLGFTDLTLSGTIAGRTGIVAGTAPAGSLLHAKSAAGAVEIKAERTTAAQGYVGFEIITGPATVAWNIDVAASSETLSIRNSSGGVVAQFGKTGLVDALGSLRATGNVAPATGTGVLARYASNIGYLESYDYTGAAWKALKIRGSSVVLSGSGVDALTATSAGVAVSGSLTIDGDDYREIIQNVKTGPYTLTPDDIGGHVLYEAAGATTLTIPTNVSAAAPIGTAVAIVNHGSSSLAIVPQSGVTVYFAGTSLTGARTLASKGVATLLKTHANSWYISGVGLS